MLCGGNLSLLAASLGTPWEIDTKGKILFLEDIGEKTYRLTLHYEKEDETELLIRVLSFGPVLKVLSPQKFREKLLHRLNRQLGLAKKGEL